MNARMLILFFLLAATARQSNLVASDQGSDLPPTRIVLHGPAGLIDTLAVAGVDISNGVSKGEARRIASAVFYDYAGIGCGTLGPPQKDRGRWRFTTGIGYGGTPGADVLVAKRDGVVTWQDAWLLQHATVDVSPGLRFAGPRPLEAGALRLSGQLATELSTLNQEIMITIPVHLSRDGVPVKLGPVLIRPDDQVSGSGVVEELSRLLLTWRFYPESAAGDHWESDHLVTFVVRGSPQTEP